MGKILTSEQIKSYHSNGFLCPYNVFTPAEAGQLSAKVVNIEARVGGELQAKFRVKAHLPFPWLCDVVRNERLLDAVEDIIGPDILCWGASFFAKKARDPRFISWHNDAFFYPYEPQETLSAWVSFNVANIESGCIHYIPGSHLEPDPVHVFKPEPANLASDGRTIVGVDESLAVPALLAPGQVVFHHERVIHGSGPNNSDHPRIGFVIHYVAPHVRNKTADHDTAILCRGSDPSGYWLPDPEPTYDLDPECIRVLEEARARFLENNRRRAAEEIK
jgi:non-heme Fe2+,alpha-ketoglutarate-dependent halogenase